MWPGSHQARSHHGSRVLGTHPPRMFNNWEQHKSPTAKQALDWSAAIYAIEARAACAPIAERVGRHHELAPRLDAFFLWAEAKVAKLSAKATLAEAFRYTLNRR